MRADGGLRRRGCEEGWGVLQRLPWRRRLKTSIQRWGGLIRAHTDPLGAGAVCVHLAGLSPWKLSSQFFSQSVSSVAGRVQLFATPWTAPRQSSLSIANSRSLLKLMSIEPVMPSNRLILCRPLLLLPPIPPASGSSPVSQLFVSGGQSIEASTSASVLTLNIQG